MQLHKLAQELRTSGLSSDETRRVVLSMQADQKRALLAQKANDWGFLLAPLTKAVASLASSEFRWRTDPLREPVYSAYLLTLRRTRDRINTARKLNVAGDSIPQVAANAFKTPLPQQGMTWQAWVPEKVRHALVGAFEQMYNTPGMRGKRLVPFSTAGERSVSDARWDVLEMRIARLTTQHEGDSQQTPLVAALNAARTAVHRRGLQDKAPIKWEHLLDAKAREELREWQARTMHGLDTDGKHVSQGQSETAGMQARVDAARQRAKEKQTQYRAKHRAKRRLQALEQGLEQAEAGEQDEQA